VTGRDGGSDILRDLFAMWRRALLPLGIRVSADLLPIWRDLQAHGAAPFNTVGELRPEVVAELLAAARATAEAAGVAPDCAADGEG